MISTGILGLDKHLGGGITGGVITDIFGPAGSGKTQLAMQICVNAMDRKIIYHDTTGGFRPERMLQMMAAGGVAPDLMDNVIVARITNTAEQVKSLDGILQLRPALVVIDSISDLFSFEYSRESNSLEKHIRFMSYMHSLSLICVRNGIPAVVTNVVRGLPGEERENLDKSISIFTHRKIRLSKHGVRFLAQVLPSFDLRKETVYEITEAGLREAS